MEEVAQLETPETLTHQAESRFRAFLTKKGLRVTSQRIAIFEAAYNATDHFTAEDLLEIARGIDHSVSRATVYRSLPILTESSLIREIDVGHDNKYYSSNRDCRNFQAQVVCDDCGKIFELDAPFMDWYGKAVSDKLGMVPLSHRLQVIATCPRFHKDGQCPEKQSGHHHHA